MSVKMKTFSLWAAAAITTVHCAGANGLSHSIVSRQTGNESQGTASEVDLQISTGLDGRNKTAPLLYGWMIEDISHSIDGGLYGELIANRAFQGSDFRNGALPGFGTNGQQNYLISADNPVVATAPTPLGYRSIGGARLTLDAFHPLTDELPISMRVDIPLNATGQVGFLNEGWWGMQVTPQTYNASFYILPYEARGNYSALSGINVSLMSNLTDEVFATERIPASSDLSGFDWNYLSGQIHNTAVAPNSNNTFAVTFDAEEVRGATIYFNFISLFGETFKDRPNGMRKDLAESIYELKPRFLRFPGGNNMEGESIAKRWIWNETIGPLIHRKGRPGDWGYYNTNGFGLLEYLEWTEDMEMERVLAIYAGYSLDQTSYPQDRMGEVLQSALDELEYCMGDVSTPYGKLRAEHGHPEPFEINYVEIGNEDWFSSTYPRRFPFLLDGLQAVYPDIKYISSTFDEAKDTFNYTLDLPPGVVWDRHHYQEPKFYKDQYDFFDHWQENTSNPDVTVMVGEYSVIQIDTPNATVNYSFPADVHVFYPRLLSAINEGIFLLGCERNPNVAQYSSFAPSFGNLNRENWTPNLVSFTANPNETILSTSFYTQKLFNQHQGTETLPIINTAGDLDPLWWASSIEDSKVYLKLINSGNSSVPLRVDLDVPWTGVNGTIITHGDLNGSNYINNRTAIVPVPIEDLDSAPSGDSGVFVWTVPAYSVNVLQFET